MFASRGRRMADNNLRQAMVPVGATVIPQTRGTAPGLICPLTIDGADKVVFAVPGVPHEMQDMFHRGIIPELQRRSGERFVIASRVLRTWGESESGLNERLDGLIAELDEVGNPTLAFLASGWNGLKVRLTAKAVDTVEASKLIGTWERRLRDELGDLVFGVDDDTMESVVLDLMREEGWSLGCAESVTGGLVGARLTGIAGASDVFRGSIVSYATEVKQQVLGVPEGPVVTEDGGARDGAGCPSSARMRCRARAHRRRRAGRAGRDAGRHPLLRSGVARRRGDPHVPAPRPPGADAPVQRDQLARLAASHGDVERPDLTRILPTRTLATVVSWRVVLWAGVVVLWVLRLALLLADVDGLPASLSTAAAVIATIAAAVDAILTSRRRR